MNFPRIPDSDIYLFFFAITKILFVEQKKKIHMPLCPHIKLHAVKLYILLSFHRIKILRDYKTCRQTDSKHILFSSETSRGLKIMRPKLEHYTKSAVRPNNKIPVFRVTRSILNLLVKPTIFFSDFL